MEGNDRILFTKLVRTKKKEKTFSKEDAKKVDTCNKNNGKEIKHMSEEEEEKWKQNTLLVRKGKKE